MIALIDILEQIEVRRTAGPENPEIGQLTFDSRSVGPGDVFVALRGTQSDGHRFIPDAVRQGAAVIVLEDWPNRLEPGRTYVQVPDTRRVLGLMASSYYGKPSRQLSLVGITGTNGKTTTATLLYRLFTELGYKVGLLSTIENRIGDRSLPTAHTTLFPVELQARLAEMVESGCSYAFMEVSSHALDQQRTAGLEFAGAVFTNISHDHLDYHRTFKDYIFAKKKLFDHLPAEAFALTNLDDKRGAVMLQNTLARTYTYSLRRKADFKARILESELSGLHLELDGRDFYGRLVGDFNAYNLLAAYAVAVLLGQDRMEVLAALSGLPAAPGRFEAVVSQERSVMGVVDYAHTPDAVEKVLQSLTRIRSANGRIITVVGCGGDRDRSKRPLMARAATDYSDRVILTSDNPRSEDPEAILDEMEKGVPAPAKQKVLRISDRREAIRAAVLMAQAGDLILVAGKGHEKYQEIKGVRYPFDDLEELKKCLTVN